MSDVGNASETKAAKKNKKRKSKKTGTSEESSNGSKEMSAPEMLAVLKSQLEEAKAEKDFKRCSELRDQVWVLSDIVAGVRTRIEEKELNRIIESIHKQFHPESAAEAANNFGREPQASRCTTSAAAANAPTASAAASGATSTAAASAANSTAAASAANSSTAAVSAAASSVIVEDKKMKALRKKLDQIEALKERQAKGEKLELNQIEKIKSEDSLRKEMKEMEELLQSVLITKQ